MTQKRPRKDKKFAYTHAEFRAKIYDALMWASDGMEYQIPGQKPVPLVMGDPENLSLIIAEALTVGLPDSEDSSSASTA